MSIASLVIFAIMGPFTPGPNNIMSMTIAGKHGFKKAFPFALGVGAGFFIVLILAALLNTLLQSVIPQIQFVMSLIGAAYILFLCYTLLRNKPSEKKANKLEQPGFFTAILLQFVNPKGILYAITIMSESLKISNAFPMVVMFLFLYSFLVLTAMTTWAFIGVALDKFFKDHRKVINIIMVVLLLYCAVMMVLPH